VTAKASIAGAGRVLERRRAVALARHYRDFESLSIREIADRWENAMARHSFSARYAAARARVAGAARSNLASLGGSPTTSARTDGCHSTAVIVSLPPPR